MKENQNLDFKKIWKDEYLKYVSGFANSEGGVLLIGVDDNGNVVGVDNAQKLLENLPNKMGISWDAELEIPTFNEEFNGVAANIKREVFYAIQHGARIDERTGKLTKPVDDTKNDTKNDTKKTTDRQRLIIDLLSIGNTDNDTKNDTKTTGALAARLGMSLTTIKRDLKYLQEIGLIEHCGPSRGGHWKVLIRNRRSE